MPISWEAQEANSLERRLAGHVQLADWDHLQYEQRLQVNYCTRLQPFILVMNGPDHQLQYRRKILNIFCYSDLQYPGACGPLDSDLTGGSGLHKL